MNIKRVVIPCIVALATTVHGASGELSIEKKAGYIISTRCTGCHGEDRIRAAFDSGRDMRAIQMDMQRRGAKLTGSEQEVLGIYWKKRSRTK